MPNKNKRFRRNLPQTEKQAAPLTTAPTSSPTPRSAAAVAAPVRPAVASRLATQVNEAYASVSYISSELKYIGVVTGIVILVLVLFYIFLH
jgi:hypothetical protein